MSLAALVQGLKIVFNGTKTMSNKHDHGRTVTEAGQDKAADSTGHALFSEVLETNGHCSSSVSDIPMPLTCLIDRSSTASSGSQLRLENSSRTLPNLSILCIDWKERSGTDCSYQAMTSRSRAVWTPSSQGLSGQVSPSPKLRR